MTHATKTDIDKAKTTVFFNSECPVCSAEICHYDRIKKNEATRGHKLNISFIPIIDNPDVLRAHGLKKADIERRLYALDSDGTLISGIDAFIKIWSELPRYRWLSKFTALPPIHFLGALMYEHVAVPLLAQMNERRKVRARRTAQEKK
jgi:predicted DCC family thiol-disulfide oxidoreductase YuxK